MEKKFVEDLSSFQILINIIIKIYIIWSLLKQQLFGEGVLLSIESIQRTSIISVDLRETTASADWYFTEWNAVQREVPGCSGINGRLWYQIVIFVFQPQHLLIISSWACKLHV